MDLRNMRYLGVDKNNGKIRAFTFDVGACCECAHKLYIYVHTRIPSTSDRFYQIDPVWTPVVRQKDFPGIKTRLSLDINHSRIFANHYLSKTRICGV